MMLIYWQKNNKHSLKTNKNLKKVLNLSIKMRKMKNNNPNRLIKKLMN